MRKLDKTHSSAPGEGILLTACLNIHHFNGTALGAHEDGDGNQWIVVLRPIFN